MDRKDFTQEEREAVWQKALVQPGNNSDIFRKDYAGAWIKKDQYGNTNSKYGWQIDHVIPVSKGGSDDINNLLPLHYKNNLSKGDDYPEWTTVLSSDGIENVEKEQKWAI